MQVAKFGTRKLAGPARGCCRDGPGTFAQTGLQRQCPAIADDTDFNLAPKPFQANLASQIGGAGNGVAIDGDDQIARL